MRAKKVACLVMMVVGAVAPMLATGRVSLADFVLGGAIWYGITYGFWTAGEQLVQVWKERGSSSDRPLVTQSPNQPDWYPDPFGRFQFRYWEGTGWTSAVSTGGRTYEDAPT